MLTPLGTKENNSKFPTDYYYTSPEQHYYCPISISNDLNNGQHYRPSIYETNQYFTLSPGYSHQQVSNDINEDESKNQIPSTVYLPTYHQHYSPEEHANEMLYSQKSSNQPIASAYDYNLPSIPPHPSNTNFHQQSNYIQPSVEQPNGSTNNSNGYVAPYLPLDGACRSGSIVVELLNRPLWLKFIEHTLENIITKPGRRMYPTLEFKVYGLKPEAMYDMYVDMVLVDVNHWKFNSGQWIPSGQAEQCQKTNHRYLHPDSPNTGMHWMKNEKISFSKLKLTNNKQLAISNSQNQMAIIVNSMHKYMPRLNIFEVACQSTDSRGSSNRNNSSTKHIFTFPETQFIAVTAYQNTDVTQLKIDNNPFAKGFRESSDNRNNYYGYSYNSPSPPYGNESNLPVNYYGNTYENQPVYKKKRNN
ncbi:unnamed protein product [Rotaria socialis]|uniref:T-box domain-containing protein n=1 Tax=Rotaria socialis TaxID=392032 RepID=A0A819WP56_9BILA|nr:unnamed protein product [Rotaria socialis]CAF3554673.1 unnamed protein product [Rotaria socialis]CAF3560895.1 unnamed protein product [Rotaria socialis]CAF4129301.1 unnamed protein product [Rotaria socialis]CAF4366322.1 unnamed protein product [Rotaria socialis]